jgi:hypothetical protein
MVLRTLQESLLKTNLLTQVPIYLAKLCLIIKGPTSNHKCSNLVSKSRPSICRLRLCVDTGGVKFG